MSLATISAGPSAGPSGVSPWKLHRILRLEEIEPLWRNAFERAPGSFFQRFEPSLHWARVYAADGSLRIWSHEPGPALAAFTLHQGRLALLGQGLFDYVDLVGEASLTAQRQLACQLLDWDEWRQFDATGVPADSPFTEFWQAFAPEQKAFSVAPLLRYLDRFSSAHPRLARRLRQYRRTGWVLRQVRERHERQAFLPWILEQKRQTLQAQGCSNVLDGDAARWLQAMVEHEPVLTELWQLYRGAETAAGLLTWRSTSVRSAYTISYRGGAAAMSPGILLLYGVLCDSVAEGLHFDFLTGEQPFKLRFADARRHLLRVRRSKSVAEEWITHDESGTEDRIR